jgi:hypothetical protein
VQRLIEQAKSVRPVLPAARARVLRRAQSSALLGASGALSTAPWSRTAASPATWLGGAALAVSLAGAGLALYGHERRIAAIDRAASSVSIATTVGSHLEPAPVNVAPAAIESAAPASSTAESAHVLTHAPVIESYAAELALLRRAHSAYGNHDFATALRLLAEHRRDFPNGRLAEEREALRVGALSGSGRLAAARLAARAFAVHFPRSVLLSRTMAAADAASSSRPPDTGE